MDTISTIIQTVAKEKLFLFQGKRNQDADQKIYELAYEACFMKTIDFFDEQLSDSKKTEFDRSLESLVQSADTEGLTKLTEEYIDQIADGRSKLKSQLEHFIDYLIQQGSLQKNE